MLAYNAILQAVAYIPNRTHYRALLRRSIVERGDHKALKIQKMLILIYEIFKFFAIDSV